MPTTTNFGWTTPADTDLVKDGAAAIRTLAGNIDTSLVDLKGGTTGQVLAKASDTDLDYSWVAQDDSNAIQNAIIDAKGDLIAGSAADTPAILSVGANDTVLTADSSTATGLKWATPAAGGGLTLLSTTTLSGTSTTISSINQTYTNLLVIINDPYFNTAATLLIKPNNTTGITNIVGIQTASIFQSSDIKSNTAQTLPTTSTPNNTFCLQIFNYASTTNGKNIYWTGTQTDDVKDLNLAGGIRTPSAISSLVFTSTGASATFSGGTVLIYGVK